MHLLSGSTKKPLVLLPLALCIATVVCAGGVAHAVAVASTVLDFEDLWPGDQGSGTMPDGYRGFTWGNASWITKDLLVSSGYQNTIEGHVGICTAFASTLSMAGSPFDLIGCKLGAAWKTEGQGVTFEGKRGGATVYSAHFVAPYTGAYVVLNFHGVDQVLVRPDTQGYNEHVVLDNVEVIVAASPVTTELVAADVSGNVGQTVQLSATLTAGGIPVGGKTVGFQVDGVPAGSATTDPSGVARVAHTIQSMGDKVIAAGFAGDGTYLPSADAANLAVYNNVDGIGLFLNKDLVAAGETTTATVVNAAGQILTLGYVLAIDYGAGGSWAGNVYTSSRAGTWTVQVTYGPLADTTPLTVNHGAPTSLAISPINATITTASSQTYTVEAADAQGNTWTPDAAEVTWTTDGAGAFAGNTYTPDAADEGATVDNYATVDGVDSNHAALTVNPASGAGLILAWDRDDQNFYLCANPADPQTAGDAGRIPGAANGTFTVNGVSVTVRGSTTNLTVSVNNTAGVPNTLRVRWYARSGVVSQAYTYSTIAGVKNNATFTSGRTLVDGQYKTGFWGLIHTPDAPDPTSITYGASEQP